MTRTQDSIEVRHSELSAELSSSFDTQVAVIGWREGFDYHADLALAPGQWTRVVLSPRVEELSTSYEGSVDFGEVINRQALAYAAASSAGVPVPSVYLARHRRESQHARRGVSMDADLDLLRMLADLRSVGAARRAETPSGEEIAGDPSETREVLDVLV